MHNIHSQNLDLNLLALFHAVFIEKSVTVAAKHLGMSQSAASHGLARLRKTFNDQLFVRSGLAITPTLRAQELFDPIREIIDKLQGQVLPSVEFDPTKSIREFRIGASDAGEIVVLPALIRKFANESTGCTVKAVRLDGVDPAAALEEGTIELAVGSLPQRPQHLYEQVLYHHDYTVICSSNHPRLKKRMSLDDYLREGHIVVAAGTDRHLMSTALAPRRLKRKVITSVGGFLGLPWLLEGSPWIATVPTHVARAFVEPFSIRCFKLPIDVDPYPITSHWHPRSHHDPGHRWLRHVVFELMRRYPDLSP
ncbi:MAG: LysR substrate-binding domain-containing protein [Steroidobacteraceae bacterium]